MAAPGCLGLPRQHPWLHYPLVLDAFEIQRIVLKDWINCTSLTLNVHEVAINVRIDYTDQHDTHCMADQLISIEPIEPGH